MPICAFDISSDGVARPVMDIDDRAAVPAQGYRWVHFDRADSDLEHWIADNVPELPGQALLHRLMDAVGDVFAATAHQQAINAKSAIKPLCF
ncbi:hypothetical protein [Ascidiaceihabitans sp.]|uniref:hypothetical protein n=1 Tax=Ascidiaceihabitans sp. TaxID=1872644 RepID=UPI00329A179B